MADRIVMVEVYVGKHLVHNALCRTLADVASASQGRKFRLIPHDGNTQAKEWEREYNSDENQTALGGK